MACDRGLKQVAEAATRNGVGAGVSKKAFYLAAATAGTLLGGWVFRRYFFSGQPTSPPLARPTETDGVKALEAPKRVEPIATDRLAG